MAKLQCFNKRNEAYFQKHKHSFVGFFTAGYPDKEQFFTYMKDAESCGMGIFEIGFPQMIPMQMEKLFVKAMK